MATDAITQYAYADLAGFPDDNLRREIIDGELIVTPAPATRHQRIVMRIAGRLFAYMEAHGGEVFPAPTDVYFSDSNVVEPDVLFIGADHLERVERGFIRSAPDIVVEVSSPSTRRLELVRKRDLYERFGVPEYWYVDLDADRVEVYRLRDGHFDPPEILRGADRLGSSQLPGWSVSVDDVLGTED